MFAGMATYVTTVCILLENTHALYAHSSMSLLICQFDGLEQSSVWTLDGGLLEIVPNPFSGDGGLHLHQSWPGS
jgi:hypothetical protein